MKIAVIGATGRAGSEITSELALRGNEVLAISRSPASPSENVTPLALDAGDGEALAAALAGQDVVVSALRFADSDPDTLIAAVKKAGVSRYLVVGGAASLEVAPGVRVFDTPDFPDAYRAEAGAGITFLDRLRSSEGLDWVFLSPSALFDEGPRTGNFRLGKDSLLVAADGTSRISFADYAIALADEIQHPAHHSERFTVGY